MQQLLIFKRTNGKDNSAHDQALPTENWTTRLAVELMISSRTFTHLASGFCKVFI